MTDACGLLVGAYRFIYSCIPALNTCSKSFHIFPFFFFFFVREWVGWGLGGRHAELCSLAAVVVCQSAQNELSLREELVEYTGQETQV